MLNTTDGLTCERIRETLLALLMSPMWYFTPGKRLVKGERDMTWISRQDSSARSKRTMW